ncbi:hypothetical protein M378DRAFT_157517 [Amanita muscaria Koide BX008]|uniref:TFIIS central domain-containing protein n=1 Tax=Amanita muscaria (strain Koide BX008) TaxID=946122 RepID=A0A0C2TPV6_AMAMK|nr:hypothetical protein M378DRAFT_157517 [Amanita muscaria Koide BX008]
MNWEGPSAFEGLSEDKSATSAQPPSKRTKYLPEPKLESEESEEEPSSDDEYVVDPSQAKGRTKRRFSVSSQSESDPDDNDRPSRRRIYRISTSPAPSHQGNLKRKTASANTAQPPPSKKKKAASITATDDPTRRYCLGKLEEIFRDVFPRYPYLPASHYDNEDRGEQAATTLVEKKSEELTDEEKAQVLERANRVATELEQCIYEIYCEPDKQGEPHAGGKYKDRFRMLQFNLSKPDRVVIHRRIASGTITPKEISLMSSTDLADEETKQHIKIVEQEALEHSILQKSTVPRAKITHKGLQDIEDVTGELVSLREREREREREQEEEERRDRERMARVRAAQSQQRQRTASMSVPPESPIVPQQSPTSWGAPPPVPTHAIASPSEETATPVSSRPPANPMFTSELTVSEPELNLDDIINMEDETSVGHDTVAAVDSPAVAPSPISERQPSTDVSDVPQESAQPPPPSPTAVTTGISPFAAKPAAPSFDLNSLWSGPSTAPSPSAAQLSTESPRVAVVEHKDVIMEPVTIHGAEDQDFDMFLEEREEKEQPPPPAPVQPKFEDLPQVWSGKISMPLESAMQETAVVARQLGGRPIDDTSVLWKTLFPTAMLRIDGRVPTTNSCTFLLQTRLNPSKELVAVAFSSADTANASSFKSISDFLIGKGRHGLVFPWGQRPKEYSPGRELYIVPLQATDPLPECIELLDNLKLPKERNNDYLIGIWVLYKGRLAPPPPLQQPQPPVQALPPLTANITSTIFGNPPSIPPTSGLDTSALAKEVATLTPEQIQNVLRTLAATSQAPLLQAPQAPPMQPQVPGQPTSLHSMPPMPILSQPPQTWNAQPPAPYPPPYPMSMHPPPPHGPIGPPGALPPPTFERQDQRDFKRDARPLGPPGPGHDRGDRGDRGGRGRGPRGRGKGRDGGSSPRQPVDSGWPQRKAWGDAKGGQPSPTRRWQ